MTYPKESTHQLITRNFQPEIEKDFFFLMPNTKWRINEILAMRYELTKFDDPDRGHFFVSKEWIFSIARKILRFDEAFMISFAKKMLRRQSLKFPRNLIRSKFESAMPMKLDEEKTALLTWYIDENYPGLLGPEHQAQRDIGTYAEQIVNQEYQQNFPVSPIDPTIGFLDGGIMNRELGRITPDNPLVILLEIEAPGLVSAYAELFEGDEESEPHIRIYGSTKAKKEEGKFRWFERIYRPGNVCMHWEREEWLCDIAQIGPDGIQVDDDDGREYSFTISNFISMNHDFYGYKLQHEKAKN